MLKKDTLKEALHKSRYCRPLASNRPSRKPLILVIENSRDTCLSFRIRLRDKFDLIFAGSKKSGNQFSLDETDIESTLNESRWMGGADAAIVDLALSEKAEAAARRRFGREDEIHEGVAALFSSQGEEETFLRALLGLKAVLMIRKYLTSIPIFIVSDFVTSQSIKEDLLDYFKLKGIKPPTIMEKTEQRYAELKEKLLTSFPEKV
jgi:hypothetical protein